MSVRLGAALAFVAVVLTTNARAADLRGAVEVHDDAPRVGVVVDELFLLRRRCQRDPDCIAPRVLPIIDGGRRGTYVSVAIPIDPRFVDRYQH